MHDRCLAATPCCNQIEIRRRARRDRLIDRSLSNRGISLLSHAHDGSTAFGIADEAACSSRGCRARRGRDALSFRRRRRRSQWQSVHALSKIALPRSRSVAESASLGAALRRKAARRDRRCSAGRQIDRLHARHLLDRAWCGPSTRSLARRRSRTRGATHDLPWPAPMIGPLRSLLCTSWQPLAVLREQRARPCTSAPSCRCRAAPVTGTPFCHRERARSAAGELARFASALALHKLRASPRIPHV